MKLKDALLEYKPREKLIHFGQEKLSDAELLAIILRTGSKKENVVLLANKLVLEYGLSKLLNMGINELKKIHGIGEVKACELLSLFELSKRINNTKSNEQLKVKSAFDIYSKYKNKLSPLLQEKFIVLHLNTRNCVIREETVFIGTLDSVTIHSRDIFRNAIKESCNSIIIIHNHPSGASDPSKEDIDITKEIIKSGKIIGINLLDHIIIGRNNYYSFLELMPRIFNN